MRKVGKRGAKRKADWAKDKQEHFDAYPYCQGHGIIPIPCGGPLQVHHKIARGMGGGKDYKVYKTLCSDMHDWVEKHREQAKELGFLKSFWEVDSDL